MAPVPLVGREDVGDHPIAAFSLAVFFFLSPYVPLIKTYPLVSLLLFVGDQLIASDLGCVHLFSVVH